jgi:molecular chaperone HtpG
MVRQFADPYAFVRELVQNSIDAGASGISVRVERAGGVATTAFRDDGTGMDRATVEGPLLTLFNSSKEGDSSKIGKYGVGFVSVFAVDPDTVDVDTWREGQSHRVRLYRDHRYDLERLPKRKGSGTIVTLTQPMEAERFAEHCARLDAALSRWCRYASCPIKLTVVDHDRSTEPVTRRIDTNLSVPAPLYVQTNRAGERVVVGPTAGAEFFLAAAVAQGDPAVGTAQFAGFYNRGLTLFETDQVLHPELRGICFRVDSPHLRHTLSRDNVLRDRAFQRVIEQVRHIARGALRHDVAAHLARAARDLARAKPPFDESLVLAYVALLQAAGEPFKLSVEEVVFPLTDPMGGDHTATAESIVQGKVHLVAPAPDALTRALARVGTPVVLAPHPGIVAQLQDRGALPQPPAQYHLLLRELGKRGFSRSDRALCEATARALGAAGVPVGRVALAKPSNLIGLPCVVLDGVTSVGEGVWLCAQRWADSAWAKERAREGILLDINDPAVGLARERAKVDVFTAAHLLARILLLCRDDPRGKLSDALFAAAAEELG